MQTGIFPTLASTREVFMNVGLYETGFAEISERFASTPQEAVARLKLRGISGFDHFSEDALAAGFGRLTSAFEQGRLTVPLEGRSDLLVLAR